MRGAAAGDQPGALAGGQRAAGLACPRCGAAIAPDLPSVAEILAARRASLPEG
jgi:hypothetical protein